MRLFASLALAALCTLAVGVARAAATNECRGLQVCVPVAGPWVVVPPGRGGPRQHVEYQLACPKSYIVGGIDAELSDRTIDLSFLGLSGSPVNPGITTTRAAVFVATDVGATHAGSTTHALSFRPHIGCIPASGGGQRVPTAVGVFPPGQPTTRRVRNVRVTPGTLRAAQGCATGERLIAGSHALGFYTSAPPAERLVGAVTAVATIHGARLTVVVRAGAALSGVRAVVQLDVVCAGGT